MSLTLSISLLFIPLMQSSNRAQFLIMIFFLLFRAAAVPVFGISIFPLTCMYAALQSHRLDFSIEF